jgi:transglycosylase-like protein with SLT domain
LRNSLVLLTDAIALLAISMGGALILNLAPAIAQDPSESPYVIAARRAGVPLELLVAVVGAESGYHPWALNIRGREVYCQSREEAQHLLATSDNVDIGLMQINWPFWGPRLKVRKDDLLDPTTNLIYGAGILKECLKREGDIWHRIGDYHSSRAKEQVRYNEKVYSAYLRYLHGQLQ